MFSADFAHPQARPKKTNRIKSTENDANLLKTLPQAGQTGSYGNKENPLRPKEI